MTPPDSPRSPADPSDDARALLASLAGPDEERVARAKAALSDVGPLGALRDLILWLAAWPGPSPQRGALRRVQRPLVAAYCASYAIAPDAPARARARLEHLAAGGGAAAGMARALGAGVEVFDLALDQPSPHPTGHVGDMMGARALAATLAFGMEAVAKGPDLLILTAETEGADVAAANLLAALAAGEGEPLRLLRRHGGREIAALAGAILAAGAERIPVILDGAPARAAAATLTALRPGALDHARDAAALVPVGEAEPGVAGLAALALAQAAAAIGDD